MKLFQKSLKTPQIAAVQSVRLSNKEMFSLAVGTNSFESQLYEQLRIQVPVIDACINKIIRLTGDFKVKCSDKRLQEELDDFVSNVRVGVSGQSLYSLFLYCNFVFVLPAKSLIRLPHGREKAEQSGVNRNCTNFPEGEPLQRK